MAADALDASLGNPGLARDWSADDTIALRHDCRDGLAALASGRGRPLEMAERWAGDRPETRLWFAAALRARRGVRIGARQARSARLDRAGGNPEASRMVRSRQSSARPACHARADRSRTARSAARLAGGCEFGENVGMATPAMGGAPRQGILSLAIKDKGALFNAYMPFVKGGGLFVPTTKRYSLGDEVFILLSLMDEKDRLPVAGKVVWITPAGAQGNRTAGIGVQFNESSRRRSGAHEDRIDPRRHPDAGTPDAHDVGLAPRVVPFPAGSNDAAEMSLCARPRASSQRVVAAICARCRIVCNTAARPFERVGERCLARPIASMKRGSVARISLADRPE